MVGKTKLFPAFYPKASLAESLVVKVICIIYAVFTIWTWYSTNPVTRNNGPHITYNYETLGVRIVVLGNYVAAAVDWQCVIAQCTLQ